MQLSSFTQYYIRKLLRQYIARLNYPASGVGVCLYFQVDLNQILLQLYRQDAVALKVRELETLVRLHQGQISQGTYSYENLAEVEQKILWILDLKFLALLPATALSVVPETLASPFFFLFNGGIREGIRCHGELYGKVLEFRAQYDLSAYQLLFTLAQRPVPFVFTVSNVRHAVWVSLRSSEYYSLVDQGDGSLEKIAACPDMLDTLPTVINYQTSRSIHWSESLAIQEQSQPAQA